MASAEKIVSIFRPGRVSAMQPLSESAKNALPTIKVFQLPVYTTAPQS
jgi:hypothetical protein